MINRRGTNDGHGDHSAYAQERKGIANGRKNVSGKDSGGLRIGHRRTVLSQCSTKADGEKFREELEGKTRSVGIHDDVVGGTDCEEGGSKEGDQSREGKR